MNNFQTKEVAICDCGINGVKYVAVGFVDTKVAIALCGVVGAHDEDVSREIAAHIATMWNANIPVSRISIEGIMYIHHPSGTCECCAAQYNEALCKRLSRNHNKCCYKFAATSSCQGVPV